MTSLYFPGEADCHACGLCEGRRVVVAGEGPVPVDIMVIGEGPGREEDREGRPFVGRSGLRLNHLLEQEAGLKREDVFVTNAVKCRPPGNRTPTSAEMRACRHWLDMEIAAVNPKVILTVGAVPLKLLTPKVRLASQHGRAFPFGERVIIPLYHPAAGMRNPSVNTILISDFRKLFQEIRLATKTTKPETSLVQAVKVDQNYDTFAFDLETTTPSVGGRFAPYLARPVGFSVAFTEDSGLYTNDSPASIRTSLEGSLQTKVCWNTKFEYTVLKNMGVTLVNFEDPKLAAYLLEYPSTHLKVMALDVLGYKMTTFQEMAKGRDPKDIPPEEIASYGAVDSVMTLRLWNRLKEQLQAADLWDVYTTIERPLIPILAEMELCGVYLNVPYFTELSQAIHTEASALAKVAKAVLGVENLASAKQLREALYTRMHMPVPHKTETGLASVDEAALLTLLPNAPIVQSLLDWRTAKTALGTFVDKLPQLVDADSRVHGSFNQAGGYEETSDVSRNAPTTGRLSSSGPNLQNIPKTSKYGKAIRRGFAAPPGRVLVQADVSQEELRIAAFLANETRLLNVFARDRDAHEETAKLVFGRTSKELRTIAKNMNYAFIYGANPKKALQMAPELGTLAHAAEVIEAWYAAYPRIREWQYDVIDTCARQTFVTTYYGRRRTLPGIHSNVKALRAAAEREAINSVVQGTGADIIKLAMVKVAKDLTNLGQSSRLVLSVHDELVVECAEADGSSVAAVLQRMTDGLFPIQLPVEVSIGPNWADTIPVV